MRGELCNLIWLHTNSFCQYWICALSLLVITLTHALAGALAEARDERIRMFCVSSGGPADYRVRGFRMSSLCDVRTLMLRASALTFAELSSTLRKGEGFRPLRLWMVPPRSDERQPLLGFDWEEKLLFSVTVKGNMEWENFSVHGKRLALQDDAGTYFIGVLISPVKLLFVCF